MRRIWSEMDYGCPYVAFSLSCGHSMHLEARGRAVMLYRKVYNSSMMNIMVYLKVFISACLVNIAQ